MTSPLLAAQWGARVARGTCAWELKKECRPPTNDVLHRMIFCRYRSQNLPRSRDFSPQCAVQCGAGLSIWPAGVSGMPRVFVPSTSCAASSPFQIGNVPTRTWANLQTTLPPREPLSSSAAYALVTRDDKMWTLRAIFSRGLLAYYVPGRKPIDAWPKRGGTLVRPFSDTQLVRRAARYSDFFA